MSNASMKKLSVYFYLVVANEKGNARNQEDVFYVKIFLLLVAVAATKLITIQLVVRNMIERA